jgi:hypothetical protein
VLPTSYGIDRHTPCPRAVLRFALRLRLRAVLSIATPGGGAASVLSIATPGGGAASVPPLCFLLLPLRLRLFLRLTINFFCDFVLDLRTFKERLFDFFLDTRFLERLCERLLDTRLDVFFLERRCCTFFCDFFLDFTIRFFTTILYYTYRF